MAWRLAKSLIKYRSQIDAAYPKRSKASDGTIGDPAHASRPSDHNPNSAGVVTAIDITHDPKNGVNIQAIFDELVASRDTRIKYLIFNRRIWTGGSWKAYNGTNPHTKHGHLSVSGIASLYDSARTWRIKPVEVEAPNVLTNKNHVRVLFLQFVNREPTAAEYKYYIGKTYGDALNKLHPARIKIPNLVAEIKKLKAIAGAPNPKLTALLKAIDEYKK